MRVEDMATRFGELLTRRSSVSPPPFGAPWLAFVAFAAELVDGVNEPGTEDDDTIDFVVSRDLDSGIPGLTLERLLVLAAGGQPVFHCTAELPDPEDQLVV